VAERGVSGGARDGAAPGRARLRVLTVRGHDGADANPFVATLARALDPLADVDDFTWARALFGRYDVVHVHWAEALIRGTTPGKASGKRALWRLMLLLDRLRRRAHVATMHNLEPHDDGHPAERALIARWIESCQVRVYLSEAGLREAADPRGRVILHGDYLAYVARHISAVPVEPIAGRVLLFGALKPYKGVERLIAAFAGVAADAPAGVAATSPHRAPGLGAEPLSLRISGKASAPYAAELRTLAADSPRVELAPDRFLEHSELIAEIAAAEVVALPYRHVYNSGVALLALSAGRPLIVTDSASMRELQGEVGPEWVQLLPAEFGAADVAAAVAALRSGARAALPDLSARTWPAVAGAYVEAFRAATLAAGKAR
jgi:beta-1,4-mannosyltransferase